MILMISRTDILQEYLLPKSDGLDYAILLEKDRYGFKRDIELSLEITAGQWFVKTTGSYHVNMRGNEKRIPIKNGDVLSFHTCDGEKFSSVVIDTEIRFQVMSKYVIAGKNSITIGSDAQNDISYTFMNFISKNHASIERRGNSAFLSDTSVNGSFVNDVRIKRSRELYFGDEINIFGMKIVYLGDVIAVGTHYGSVCVRNLKEYTAAKTSRNIADAKSAVSYYRRSPRIIPTIYSETIKIEAPPEPKFSKKRPLIMQIGPSFTMAIPMLLGCGLAIFSSRLNGSASGAFMYTGLITAVGAALFGSLWAVLNIRNERKEELEEEDIRIDAYGNYLINISGKLREYYAHNRQAMFNMYPAAEVLCKYDSSDSSLWNRNKNHTDFLFYRLGLGDIPFQVRVEIPEEKFSLSTDILKEKPKLLYEDYQKLNGVPIGIDITNKPLIGIVGGGNKEGAVTIMYNIAAGIAANNCYTDVKMAFIYDENENKEQWEFVKWFPHVWSENRKTRFVAGDSGEYMDVFYELANILRHREESGNGSQTKGVWKPYYVVFVSDPAILENQLIAKYAIHPDSNYGMTVFLLTDKHENLPNECEFIIENSASFQGMYNAIDSRGERKHIDFDRVSSAQISRLAKNLTEVRVQEYETDTEMPSSLDFFEMYGAKSLEDFHVIEQWYKNRTYNSMKALIGKKSNGEDCCLDIHEKYHGPHGLVAGTTGSGKSETLQTYMLSLAMNFSPDDIAFFVIDFKGGGMANLFKDLPHMAGQISNLSGNQIRRAMISIKSENRRRQRIFGEYGVNNINLYTRLYKSGEAKRPIPHLIIIIDEFAELKREEPDFMRELISVAQVGRSLGVHLILATQKPSGTVDDNIRSNSKFHLCLRVQDRQDSNDMLHKPDAAYITQAGRCYLQVGNDELYELFQSGWSGAVYDKNMSDNDAGAATMLTISGKQAIVGSRIKMKRKEKERIDWYDNIIRTVNYIYDQAEYDKPFAYFDSGELTEFARSVSTVLSGQYDYGTSEADVNAVRNFISLMSLKACKSGEDIVKIQQKLSGVKAKLPEIKEKTQLEVLVKYLRKLADENGFNNEIQLWLPVLPSELYWTDIVTEDSIRYNNGNYNTGGGVFELKTVVGMYDDPENQLQLPVTVDFSVGGHLAVCGTVVSGKSTFLQTMIYGLVNSYSPEELNFYILDFSSHMLSCYEKLPHTGGIMYENDYDKISKFFTMLDKHMNERRKLLGGGNFSQYIKAYGKKLPAIIVVIDNFANFREKTDGVYDGIIMRLAREGVGYGIYMTATSAGFGIGDIPGRIADNIRNVICLEMGDKYKYMEVMRLPHLSVLPETGVKGRGIVKLGENVLEFQTALSVKAPDDYMRSSAIEAWAENLKNNWKGAAAAGIPCIPEKPDLRTLMQTEGYEGARDSVNLLPIGYNYKYASLESIDLSEIFCYVISGRMRTGKTNAIKIIMDAASYKNGRMAVIEKEKNELRACAAKYGADYIEKQSDLYKFLSDIKTPFAQRNKKKHRLMEEGMDDKQIYEQMSEETPVFVFIASLEEFIDMAYTVSKDVGAMSGFVENIFDKGELHNIYFFACSDSERYMEFSARNAFKLFVSKKKGMHLGGNLDKQKIFTASNIPFSEQSKSMPRGTAFIPFNDDDAALYKAVIAMYGGDKK